MKYKVGDRVRIKSWEQMEKEFGIDLRGNIECFLVFTRGMKQFCGKELTISREGSAGYSMQEDNEEYSWSDDMIAGLANDKSIHITVQGDTTHAILKDGKNVVKRTKAICSPSDTFDFETGAKLAFERLLEKEVREVKRIAEVGEYIKIVRPLCSNGYRRGDILKVLAKDQWNHIVGTKPETNIFILEREYVVLENYSPPAEPEPELPTFTFAGFKRGDFVVNCQTEEDANIFCAYLHGKGERWFSGGSYIPRGMWHKHGENTCYYGSNEFSSKDYPTKNGYTIIPFNAEDLD